MSIYVINMPRDNGVKYDLFRYPAGEAQVRFKPEEIEAVRIADQLIIIANIYDGDVMPLALLNDAVNHLIGPRTRKGLILPYLPYSRADRRFTDGDCFALKVFGNILDTMGFDRIGTFDVHSPLAKKYIANLRTELPDDFIYQALQQIDTQPKSAEYFATGYTREELKSMHPNVELTAETPVRVGILLPDKGAARYNLKTLGYPIFQADKVREPQTGKLTGFMVPTAEQLKDITDLLIVDDICDGGGTFVGIADELKKVAPQIDLYLYVSHGIFSAGLGRLGTAFKKIFTTDSFIKNTTLEKESAGLVEVL